MGKLTAESLRRWRADVVAFAEEALHVRDPETGNIGPLKLTEHQANWLREATRRDEAGKLVNKTVVASWPKREGKSLVVAILVAHRLVCFDRQDSVVLANSERQAQSNVFKAVADFFRDSPLLKPLAPGDALGTSKITVEALGNTCEVLPCNASTVQGRAVTGIMASDELHAVQDRGAAFSFLSAQCESVDAQVAISSQAGAPVDSNPLWLMYQAAQAGELGLFFDYRQEHVLPWAIRLGERQKKTLLPGQWDYMHRNCWGATGITLLPANLIEAAIGDYREPRTREEWDRLQERWGPPEAIGIGLDRAGVSKRGDRSVWSVAGRWPGSVFRLLRCAVLQTGSEAEILAEYERTLEVFGPCKALFETYGCSDIVEKIPRATLGAPTSQRQQALFGRLYRAFEEARMQFPERAGIDPKTKAGGLLKAELSAFEYDTESAVLVRYGTQSGHDDTVYSLAWALECAEGGRATRPAVIYGSDPDPDDDQGEPWGWSSKQSADDWLTVTYSEHRPN